MSILQTALSLLLFCAPPLVRQPTCGAGNDEPFCQKKVEVRQRDVDLLETNKVINPDGSERFTQIVAWDRGWDDDNRSVAIDRGYKVVNNDYPAVHSCGDSYRVVWWCGDDTVYVLNAKQHIATTTYEDREAQFRQYGGRFRPCW